MSAPHDPPPPDTLRYLRVLVTTLTLVLIVGIATIVILLVVRLGSPPTPAALALPDEIKLPDGTTPHAVTLNPDWIVVLTEGGELLLYDRADASLRHRIVLD